MTADGEAKPLQKEDQGVHVENGSQLVDKSLTTPFAIGPWTLPGASSSAASLLSAPFLSPLHSISQSFDLSEYRLGTIDLRQQQHSMSVRASLIDNHARQSYERYLGEFD